MGTIKDSELTRQKIVQAAGQLFAARGFSGVTVREIVKSAKTHLSALNYHFRSKEALYQEVVLQACKSASISAEYKQQLQRLEPRKALLVLVQEFLNKYDKQKAFNWQLVVITREIWEPSKVFQEVVEEFLRPETEFISRILGQIADQPSSAAQVRFAVVTMLGLVETFSLYGHLIAAVAPEISGSFEKKGVLAEHITHLVIEAVYAYRQDCNI